MAHGDSRLESCLITAIEALYRVEQDDQAWMAGLNDPLWPGFANDCVAIELLRVASDLLAKEEADQAKASAD
jgi:hypothetical protein